MYNTQALEKTKTSISLALQQCNYKWIADALEEANRGWILDVDSRPCLEEAQRLLIDAMSHVAWTCQDLREAHKALKNRQNHNLFRFLRHVREFNWSSVVMQSVTVFYHPDIGSAGDFLIALLNVLEQMMLEWHVESPYVLPELTLCYVPWDTCEPIFARSQVWIRFAKVSVVPFIEEHQQLANFLLT